MNYAFTQTRATYGGLCGMPAWDNPWDCGICDTRLTWRRGPVFECTRKRVLVLPNNLYTRDAYVNRMNIIYREIIYI